jgi:hypothetical protein
MYIRIAVLGCYQEGESLGFLSVTEQKKKMCLRDWWCEEYVGLKEKEFKIN